MDRFDSINPQGFLREHAVDPLCKKIRNRNDFGELKSFTDDDEKFEVTLCRTATDCIQIMVTETLKDLFQA